MSESNVCPECHLYLTTPGNPTCIRCYVKRNSVSDLSERMQEMIDDPDTEEMEIYNLMYDEGMARLRAEEGKEEDCEDS